MTHTFFKSAKIRIHILSIFLFFVLPSYAQKNNVTVESTNQFRCGNSEYVIVNKKQKQGIYNSETKKFDIKPRLSFFYYFDLIDVLFEIQESNQIVIYNLGNDENPLAPILLENCSTQLIIQGGSYFPNLGNVLLQEGKLFRFNEGSNWQDSASNALTNDLTNQLHRDAHFFFGIDVNHQFATIYDYRDCNYEMSRIVIPSYNNLEDSFDLDNNTVYYPRNPGFSKSGVLNLQTNKWDIPQAYNCIYKFNHVYFAIKKNYKNENDSCYYQEVCDIYAIIDGILEPTIYQNLWTNGGFNAGLIFPNQKITRDKDSSFIFVHSDKGTGLYELRIFNKFWQESGYAPQESVPQFYCDTLFNPEYTFVLKSGRDENIIYTYDTSGICVYKYLDQELKKIPKEINTEFYRFEDKYWATDVYLFDGKYATDTSGFYWGEYNFLPSETPISKHWAQSGISILNDSLVYIQSYFKENWDDAIAFESILYHGEDSLDANGNVIYYSITAGQYESGIYNYKQHNWFIPNEYVWIQKSNSGYLLCSAIVNNNYFLNYSYSFRDFNNQIVFEHASIDDLPSLGIILSDFGLE